MLEKLKKLNKKICYEIMITSFIIISITLIILDFLKVIDISIYPYKFIDKFTLCFFWIDYVYLFIKSNNKKQYFLKNILNLIAILPLNEILSFLRISRIFRFIKILRFSKFTKLARLIRLLSFVFILRKNFEKFLKTNGFIYTIYCSLALIISSSIFLSLVENITFFDALWYSIVTTTTVGYGDISPSTPFGKIIAVILIIFGIGFIGMLSATITTFFLNRCSEEKLEEKLIDNDLLELIESLDEETKINVINFINLIKNNKNINIEIKK